MVNEIVDDVLNRKSNLSNCLKKSIELKTIRFLLFSNDSQIKPS